LTPYNGTGRGGVHAFREAVERGDRDGALACLHQDVRFRSPVVFKPYEGRDEVAALLRHVFEVFEDFAYEDEIADGARTVLFFTARVGDRRLEGLDDLTTDSDGLIIDFRVMVRPMSGMIALAEAMAKRLQ
jgi:limonene-1,2-epoxide hydrolase